MLLKSVYVFKSIWLLLFVWLFIKYSLSSKPKLKVVVELKDVGGYIAGKGAIGTGASERDGAGGVGGVEMDPSNDTLGTFGIFWGADIVDGDDSCMGKE